MAGQNASREIRLVGTVQPDVPGRILRAGPSEVEFDGGQCRYLRVNGVEVLRAVSFLVRDENWGTYVPALSKLRIDQRKDGFAVSYHAVCRRDRQEIAFDVSITGDADGNLVFEGVAVPKTDFLTARTGFVVLHPLEGVVGNRVEVEHVDGKVERSVFPKLVNPVQPFLHIRALTHEFMPGAKATVRMEGDTWEMEDHRNWTDASFKTYVRPLALPWPYVLKAGETVRQTIRVSLSGAIPKGAARRSSGGVTVSLGSTSRNTVPPVGLGMPPEEIPHAVDRLALLRAMSPGFLVGHHDPRAGHGLRELYGLRFLCEQTGAKAVLEIVVESLEGFAAELREVARLVDQAGLRPDAVAVCPVGDLKSVLPGGERPPAPPLEALYAAAREAFPGVRLGGGMFSFFTELNRKRPPAELLDFVTNTTCPIVHAADDRSVMETLEALPYQVATAKSFIGRTPHRVGPSAIGCRDNPHGATFTPNPDNERVCLARMDPRMRGLFGAAWFTGYIATFARSGIDTISVGAPAGPLGFIYRKTDFAQPGLDDAGTAVYPAYHVVSGLARAAGARIVNVESSARTTVDGFAYKVKGATLLWLANRTAATQTVQLDGLAGRSAFVGVLDETSFDAATREPFRFQAKRRAVSGGKLSLKAYGVAWICVND
ncbi:MAG: hypothetical protein GC151_03970 [Betaproteobacteria bacterium]|nr:hypothetical protein [Betaproteobacteria bacterium]